MSLLTHKTRHSDPLTDDVEDVARDRLHTTVALDPSKLGDVLNVAAGALLRGGMTPDDVLLLLTDRREFNSGVYDLSQGWFGNTPPHSLTVSAYHELGYGSDL